MEAINVSRDCFTKSSRPAKTNKEAPRASPLFKRTRDRARSLHPDAQLFLDAGIGGLPGAFVEAGKYRVIHLFALDQIDHDRRRLVTHLERPLTDQRFDATFLGDRDFIADGIGGGAPPRPSRGRAP